jgi:hypothetical protein
MFGPKDLVDLRDGPKPLRLQFVSIAMRANRTCLACLLAGRYGVTRQQLYRDQIIPAQHWLHTSKLACARI